MKLMIFADLRLHFWINSIQIYNYLKPQKHRENIKKKI